MTNAEGVTKVTHVVTEVTVSATSRENLGPIQSRHTSPVLPMDARSKARLR